MTPEEALVERMAKVAAHNAAVHQHNAAIERKIEKLKQAMNRLTAVQAELDGLKTDKIQHGGENVWRGNVYREHQQKVGYVKDDIDGFSSLMGDAFEDYSNTISRLKSEKKSYWII